MTIFDDALRRMHLIGVFDEVACAGSGLSATHVGSQLREAFRTELHARPDDDLLLQQRAKVVVCSQAH